MSTITLTLASRAGWGVRHFVRGGILHIQVFEDGGAVKHAAGRQRDTEPAARRRGERKVERAPGSVLKPKRRAGLQDKRVHPPSLAAQATAAMRKEIA